MSWLHIQPGTCHQRSAATDGQRLRQQQHKSKVQVTPGLNSLPTYQAERPHERILHMRIAVTVINSGSHGVASSTRQLADWRQSTDQKPGANDGSPESKERAEAALTAQVASKAQTMPFIAGLSARGEMTGWRNNASAAQDEDAGVSRQTSSSLFVVSSVVNFASGSNTRNSNPYLHLSNRGVKRPTETPNYRISLSDNSTWKLTLPHRTVV